MTQKNVNAVVVQPEKSAVEVIGAETLISKAIEAGSSIETMERLLAMRDKIRMELAENDFREAMSRFQGLCPVVVKRKVVLDKTGKPRYSYAPLDDIVDQVKPFLAECGFSFKTDTLINQGPPAGITSIVRVHHVGGFSEESSFFAPIDPGAYMTAPQIWASAQTFAKRYAFCNAFGILTGDEDTDAGDVKPEKQPEKTQTEAPLNHTQIVSKFQAELKTLPPEIKEQFKELGYTQAPAALFCDKLGWDFAKIDVALRPLIAQHREKRHAQKSA